MNETIPNKCMHCGLRVFYPFASGAETASSDKAFAEMHVLKARGILKKVPPRYATVSNIRGDFGTTSFCAINAKAWQDKAKPCKHWTMRIEGASVADYLSLHQSKVSQSLSLWLSIVAIVISIGVAAVQAVV